MTKKKLKISGQHLTLEQISDFVSNKLSVDISPEVKNNLIRGRRLVEDILTKDKPVYGINTGFGNFAEVQIKPATVNEQSTIFEIDVIIKELRTALFLVGAEKVEQITNAEVRFSNSLKMWE